MPRPRNAVPTVELHVMLPAAEHAQLELFLYSEAEQRIPAGSWQRFFVERIREFFGRASLDLALYMPGVAPGSPIYGSPALVSQLRTALEKLNV